MRVTGEDQEASKMILHMSVSRVGTWSPDALENHKGTFFA